MIPALALAAALCAEPARIPVGPVRVEPQCSYFAGDVDAEGGHVFGAWMTSRYGGFTPNVTGSISGGALDEAGALRGAAQQFITPAPSVPSVATNGTRSLIAYTINSGTFVQFDDALPAFRLADGKGNPQALWNGREWVVVANDGTNVVALTVDDKGTVAARKVLTEPAVVVDAIDELVLVQTSEGTEAVTMAGQRSEEHTSELQSRQYLVCRLLLEKKKKQIEHKNSIPK